MDTIRLIFIVAAAILLVFIVWKVLSIVMTIITWLILLAVFAVVLYAVFLLVRSTMRDKSGGNLSSSRK